MSLLFCYNNLAGFFGKRKRAPILDIFQAVRYGYPAEIKPQQEEENASIAEDGRLWNLEELVPFHFNKRQRVTQRRNCNNYRHIRTNLSEVYFQDQTLRH